MRPTRVALPVILAAFALAACERHPGAERADATPGQKLDTAIERTQQTLAEATAKTQQKMEVAGERIAEGSSELAAKVKDAVTPDARPAAPAANASSAPADGATVTTTVTSGPRVATTGPSPETASRIGDAAITASIKTDFLKDPDLSVLKIDVDTRDGVVTLNGLAENEAARVRAERLAGAIKGVKEVRNYLTVKRA